MDSLDEMERDYAWRQAIGFGPGFDACEYVIASDAGQNDEASWIAVFLLKSGKFGFLSAWCDFTGWDCQSGGTWTERDDLRTLALNDLGDEDRERLGFDSEGNRKEFRR